jgi:cell division protein FtsL
VRLFAHDAKGGNLWENNRMKADRPERGFISFSGILALFFLVVVVFLALRLLPPYISNYQLQDAIQNLARSASYNQVSEEDLQKSVITSANGLGIALVPKQVSVRKGSESVVIAVRYSVPVDLLVRQLDLDFEPTASNTQIVVR